MHLVRQLTRTNHCHFPSFYKEQMLDLRLISCQTYSDPSNNIKYIPRIARHNNYRRRWKNDSVTEKDQVYFRFSDPAYKQLYRKKSSRPNKMRTGNKTKNSSRIKIIEVVSSCCGFLYELYRRKVHPAPLAVSAHKEFLGVPQNVRQASQDVS